MKWLVLGPQFPDLEFSTDFYRNLTDGQDLLHLSIITWCKDWDVFFPDEKVDDISYHCQRGTFPEAKVLK